MAYGARDGSGKGVGRRGGLRRNKNISGCRQGGVGGGLCAIAFLVFSALLFTVFTGGVISKSKIGYIIQVEHSMEGSTIYFSDGSTLEARNSFTSEINVDPQKEYRVTYKEIRGGLIIKHSLYLDKLYEVK